MLYRYYFLIYWSNFFITKCLNNLYFVSKKMVITGHKSKALRILWKTKSLNLTGQQFML